MKNGCHLLVAYKPVIIFHGILASSASMDDLVKLIKESHNGTEVHDIDGYDGVMSLTPMWEQVANIKAKMLPIMQQAKDGVNMICFSQGECVCVSPLLQWVLLCTGGLVCRGILETTPDHNVHTFVSLSSPQAGQFGGTYAAAGYCMSFINYYHFVQIRTIWSFSFPTSPETIFMSECTDFELYTLHMFCMCNVYRVFYTELGQDLSIGNYWRGWTSHTSTTTLHTHTNY